MLTIRPVQASDAKDLVAIYAPYVENTAITFEYDVPTIQAFETRIATILKHYPYLVAEENGQVLGYAYASSYYNRAAYDWTCELSIYLSQDARGKGIGTLLYDSLESELKKRGFLRLLACIAVPNDPSIAFHEKRGYQQVAHFPKVGYKFDRWHDIVWMQKTLEGEALPLKGVNDDH